MWKYDKEKEAAKKAEAKVLEEKQAQLDKRPGRFLKINLMSTMIIKFILSIYYY